MQAGLRNRYEFRADLEQRKRTNKPNNCTDRKSHIRRLAILDNIVDAKQPYASSNPQGGRRTSAADAANRIDITTDLTNEPFAACSQQNGITRAGKPTDRTKQEEIMFQGLAETNTWIDNDLGRRYANPLGSFCTLD